MLKFLGNAILLCLMSTVLFVGCSGKNISVSGNVSYGGQSVERGVIEFVEVNSGPSFSGVISEGRYKLQAMPGEYRVRVTGIRAEKYVKSDKNRMDLPASGMVDVSYIPGMYNLKTELRANISAKERVHDFNLEEK